MNELLPPEIRARLPRLREQENSDDPIVYAKFFFPAAGWTWFVTEGEPQGSDFLFFGYVIGLEGEWGYFTLEELEHVNIKGIVIECDLYFEPGQLSTCLSDLNLP
jgi:hypothetical protein